MSGLKYGNEHRASASYVAQKCGMFTTLLMRSDGAANTPTTYWQPVDSVTTKFMGSEI
ncbi:MAG: hypothetical protein FD174_3007 [Geobacteraceae bacterium]|nr:MAG: hypothetical protein FD174_3007 [Geobacteraceae bacterium]